MPDEYPDAFHIDILEDDGNGDLQLTNQGLFGLMALGAAMAIGPIVGAFFGGIGATAVTTETTTVLSTVELESAYGLTEGEAMIYRSVLSKGGTVEDAAAFIKEMAFKRFLQSGQISDIAGALAAEELSEVQNRAGQIGSAIEFAILDAENRVNYQAALSQFFTSGM